MNEAAQPVDNNPVQFNESQKSRILASVTYVDKLLVDVEEILTAASSQAFPKYKNPLTPMQIRVARDYIKRLRQQIKRVLEGLEVPLPAAKFDSIHAIRVTLQFIEVAIEEIAPERLTGYGQVPRRFINPLAGGLQEMKGIVRQLDSYLVQRSGTDLSLRVGRLSRADETGALLSLVTGIIERHGLVEYRTPVQQIVEKIEAPSYEVAFFGRVSAGKSSLLNRIIGTDLLPTGVTPITAVPTRIRNRPQPALLVWTGDGQVNRYEVERIADFATEAKNSSNNKRVTRLIAEVPLPILSADLVLVDTPGLGSLALEGAAETLAYLPQCDLGVVLVEASSNLHPDDVATLDALRTASVPAAVVLSKADLVNHDDLERLVDYTRRQIIEQLGVVVPVTPLSIRPESEMLLKSWIEGQIAPRILNARRLAEESNRRKAISLAERVLHALEISIKTAAPEASTRLDDDLRNAENELREAASLLESTSTTCFQMTGRIRNAGEDALRLLVENALSQFEQQKASGPLNPEWIRSTVNRIAQTASEELALSIRSAAEKLSNALTRAAQVTANNARIERTSLESLVKELPAPDFAGCSLEITKPRSLRMSFGLARRILKRNIESKCGATLTSFFESYGRALELWFRTVLADMERQFNSNGDIYRAQLQRLRAPAETTQSNSSVLQDIAALQDKLGVSGALNQAHLPVTAEV